MYYVEVFMSPNPALKDIRTIEVIYGLPINLHGPTCELLKIHNSTNAIQIPLFYNFIIFATSTCKEK